MGTKLPKSLILVQRTTLSPKKHQNCQKVTSVQQPGEGQLPAIRELFIQGKAMVPYVQLSTSCRIGFWRNEKIFFYGDKNYQANLLYKSFPGRMLSSQNILFVLVCKCDL